MLWHHNHQARVLQTNNPPDSTFMHTQEWQEASKLLFAEREKSKPLIEKSILARHKFMRTLAGKDFNKKEASQALADLLSARDAMERSLGNGLLNVRAAMPDSTASAFFGNRFHQKGLMREWSSERMGPPPAYCDSLLPDSMPRNGEMLRERIRERMHNRRTMLRGRRQGE